MRERVEQFKGFLHDVNQEARRITWPTGREITGATSVVIITTLATALLLAMYDVVISYVLRVILH